MDAFQKALEELNELLNENGVVIKGSRYESPDRLGLVIGISGLDFSEHDKEFQEEIDRLNKQLSEKQYKIDSMEREIEIRAENYNKILHNLRDANDKISGLEEQNKELEKEIKHKQDKIDILKAYNSATHIELSHEPISVAQMLITATAKYPDADETYNIYNASDLRQIAEHLLVYCNNNKDEG